MLGAQGALGPVIVLLVVVAGVQRVTIVVYANENVPNALNVGTGVRRRRARPIFAVELGGHRAHGNPHGN